MPDGQISNTCKLSHLGLYAEKTIGGLRPTVKLLVVEASVRAISYLPTSCAVVHGLTQRRK